MIGSLPPKPTGSDSQSIFMQWVWDTLISLRAVRTPGALTSQTTRGFVVVPKPPPGKGITVALYRFKSMTSEYLVCRSWNGTAEGTVDVNIAKPFKLRATIATETLRGVVVNYSAYDISLNGQTRVATQAGTGGATETQYVTPPYLVNDLIYAIPATTLVSTPPTGTPPVAQTVGLLDLNIDAREWAAF